MVLKLNETIKIFKTCVQINTTIISKKSIHKY